MSLANITITCRVSTDRRVIFVGKIRFTKRPSEPVVTLAYSSETISHWKAQIFILAWLVWLVTARCVSHNITIVNIAVAHCAQ